MFTVDSSTPALIFGIIMTILFAMLVYFILKVMHQYGDEIEARDIAINENYVIHDFTTPMWGRDIVYKPIDNTGLRANVTGWKSSIRKGDVLQLKGDNGGKVFYRVNTISYYRDPSDMFRAEVSFIQTCTCEACGMQHFTRPADGKCVKCGK